jgi:hypothetical protein
MSQPEQIDNSQYPGMFPRGEYERFTKRKTHKLRRRQIKNYLRGLGPEPNDKQFKGWTT